MMLLGHLIFKLVIIRLVKAQGKDPIMLPNKLYQGLNNSETYKELNFTTIPTQPPKMKDLGQIPWPHQAGDEIATAYELPSSYFQVYSSDLLLLASPIIVLKHCSAH